MGGGSVNTSATRLEALAIQSSTAGAVIPWLRGQHRIPGNLLWYGDFKAKSQTQKTGGKGGGGTSTSYTYSASLVMGLCHGTIHSIPKVWKGKSNTTPASLGLTVLAGAVGQTLWSGLAGRGVQSLNYSGLAAVAALNYSLGDSASVENHSFEVRHASAYAVDASTPDVDPQQATYDLLTHPHQGAAVPASLIGDWSSWSNYCVANKLLVSPLLTTQTSARDALQEMADLTNTAIVWSDGKIKMRPYGDRSATAFGRTFTPDTTPVYELDDNCFIKQGDEAPVKRSLKSPAERYNIVKIQYRDRANGYNPAVVEAKDITDISANGARPRDSITADWICVGDVARFVAEVRKQRELFVMGEYTFRLPWHYALIECMDLLTITDSVLMLDDVPVLVKQIVEESDEELAITCEDYPSGTASAPLYRSQGMTGFALNANVSPGNALAPVVFELPGALTTTGLELAVATGSTDANWGGCQVWVSYDGSTYRQLAELRAISRYGTVQIDNGNSLALFTNAGQQLLSGSASDAASLATLIYLAPQGATPGEYVAYVTASLTAANAYTLAGMQRGAYGTTAVTHSAGAAWVRVDDAIARSGPLDPALIGKTVYIKLTSVNVFGGGQQSLADVSATAYTITGKHFVLGRPSSSLSIKLNVGDFAETVNYNEAYIHGRDASGAAIDAPGSIMVNGATSAVPNGNLFTNLGPVAGYIVWDSAGATFSTGAGARPYVLARRYQGQWQYDDNSSAWVTFTPVATHWIIGTLETGGTDAGNPGSPPGLTGGSIWAAASTLNALEAGADAAYAAAVAAQGTATTAAGNASSALGTLATMRSNGYLDAAEKPDLLRRWQAISDERAGIYDRGTAFGLISLRDAYQSAYITLRDYLLSLSPAWNDTTTDTPITPAVDQANWAAYYAARQTLLNAIADEAAKRANWSLVTGAGKPADNATVNNVTYSASAPGSAVDGDIWVDLSTTPARIKLRVGGNWQSGATLTTNTNQLADGAGLGSTAVWSQVSGTGRPADNSTRNNVTYSASAPTDAANGDLWVDTSVSPRVWRVRLGGTWQAAASYVTNTADIADGAQLGLTAIWAGVSGSGKPADNATRNQVYYQDTDPTVSPGGVVDGAIWITSTRAWQRVGGTWQPYVGAGSVDTAQLAGGSATGVATVVLATISFSNIA